ncbi:hypothetical protein DVS28_b0018 (plasmid) [Euzebya pacifica]|uniref:Uncharacterized protein n=1 Tax=Euzebya pacifica TaxID=1608957 RepID=A0A346Y5P1_9ACTN|nr:hypothetical protein [Euzebya pacifica]AXV09788.1 hypothetical protein DVS28_b0018 [Euzebya pacifica]
MHSPFPFPGDLHTRVLRWLRHHVGVDELTLAVLAANPDRLTGWLRARADAPIDPPVHSASSSSGATVNYLNGRGNRLRRLIHHRQVHVAWLHGGAADLLDALDDPDWPLSAAAVYWATADPYLPVAVDQPAGQPPHLVCNGTPVRMPEPGATLRELAGRVPAGRWGPPVPAAPTWQLGRQPDPAPPIRDAVPDPARVDVDVVMPHRMRVTGPTGEPVLPWERIGILRGWPPAGTQGADGIRTADLARILTGTGATVLPAHTAGDGGPTVGWAIPDPDIALLVCLGRTFDQPAVLLVDQQHLTVIPCKGGPSATVARIPTETPSRSGVVADGRVGR